MPLSPVSVVVGTTIATAIVVIGTGYAFKKFVYDPHLSHHIDALIAHHNQHNQPHSSRTSHEPIPVPVNSHKSGATKGTSTAYQDHHTSVRRRNTNTNKHRSTSDHNDHNFHEGVYELHERSSGIPESQEGQREYEGGASIYELDESRLSLLGDKRSGMGKLVDLEERYEGNGSSRPESPQEREVKEVIFKITPSSTPLRSVSGSGSSTPAFTMPSINPFVSPEDDYHSNGQLPQLTPVPPPIRDQDRLDPPVGPSVDPRTSSTSFSFLSLSQASSPEQINHHLEESEIAVGGDSRRSSDFHAFEHIDGVDEDGTPTIPDDNVEVLSNPTTFTDYEDAESYTPVSRSLSRTSNPPISLGVNDTVGEMGLSYVPLVPSSRGPLSVISIDGSDVSEGEWDVISEPGR